jgi:hypothetical protein
VSSKGIAAGDNARLANRSKIHDLQSAEGTLKRHDSYKPRQVVTSASVWTQLFNHSSTKSHNVFILPTYCAALPPLLFISKRLPDSKLELMRIFTAEFQEKELQGERLVQQTVARQRR